MQNEISLSKLTANAMLWRRINGYKTQFQNECSFYRVLGEQDGTTMTLIASHRTEDQDV